MKSYKQEMELKNVNMETGRFQFPGSTHLWKFITQWGDKHPTGILEVENLQTGERKKVSSSTVVTEVRNTPFLRKKK